MSVFLIRLDDSTELIADVVGFDNEAGLVKCVNPLQINYRMGFSQAAPSMSMSRFMPFAKEPIFEFKHENIIQVIEARDSVAKYYEHVLKDFIADLDDRIDEEMMRSAGQEEEPVTESDMYKEILEKVTLDGPLQ